MEKVYEIIDASSDEVYWPIGLFTSLEQAVGRIEEDMVDTESLGSHWNDGLEYETIEIRERGLGVYEEHGKTVYKLERELTHIDDDYTEYWKITGEEYL